MADRWDGCVIVATASLDLDRLLRAFRAQVGEEHLQSVEDAPDGLPVLDDAERLPRGALVTRGALVIAAPFPGVGLLLLDPPFFRDTRARSEAPSEYAELLEAVRQAAPGATALAWAYHERTARRQLLLGDDVHDFEPEDGHEEADALFADLAAQAGVDVRGHVTSVDLAPGRVSVPWDETDPAALRAAEEKLRALLGATPRVPRLDLRLGEPTPRPPTSPEDLPVDARGRAPTDPAAEQAAYASNRRLVRVLGVLVVAIVLLVALFVVMAQRWQPR